MVEPPNDEPNSRYANSSKEILETFGAQAVRFKNEVLTIFFIRRNDANTMKELWSQMNDEIFLVKFREDLMDKEQSAGYISRLAGKNPKSITDCELTTLIADDFIMPELRASRKEVRIGF